MAILEPGPVIPYGASHSETDKFNGHTARISGCWGVSYDASVQWITGLLTCRLAIPARDRRVESPEPGHCLVAGTPFPAPRGTPFRSFQLAQWLLEPSKNPPSNHTAAPSQPPD